MSSLQQLAGRDLSFVHGPSLSEDELATFWAQG